MAHRQATKIKRNNKSVLQHPGASSSTRSSSKSSLPSTLAEWVKFTAPKTRVSVGTSRSRSFPKQLSKDADRLHRFEQEARTIAALNHPNILASTTSALTQRLQLKNNSATTPLESSRHLKLIQVKPLNPRSSWIRQIGPQVG
jgi:hypothetical protein